MGALGSSPDLGAIEQLQALFSSADPARTGLLSYNEFAYLILKSGGSQEQVDALIDQFSVSSRARRMVCYAALLQQLNDSVKGGGPSHKQNSPFARKPDDTERTWRPVLPSPSPPPHHPDVNARQTFQIGDVANRCSSSSSTFHTNKSSYPEQYKPTSASPLLRSFTHTGSRGDSRDSSVVSYRPHEGQQRAYSDARRDCSSTSGSQRTPLQLSSRFVASVVHAAQQQGCAPGKLRRSDDRGIMTDGASVVPRSRSSILLQGNGSSPLFNLNADPHREDGPKEFTRAQPSSRSRSREDSVVRMARAAKDAQGRSNQRANPLQTTAHRSHFLKEEHTTSLNSNSAAFTAVAQRTADISFLSSTSWDAQHEQKGSRMHARGVSSMSAKSKTPLLSLRDVFHHYVLPATKKKKNDSNSGTVLLSELESIFAAHGVEVHPLELEAVVDSLELLPNASKRSTHSNNEDDTQMRSGVHNVSSSFPFDRTTGDSTTITGGADSTLGLVDFCVLVSRLRPGLIQRIRSPKTWQVQPKEMELVEECGDGGRDSAAFPPSSRGGRPVVDSIAWASEDEPSIADVTVSPMTPTTAGTTPQSHHGSLLQSRQRSDEVSRLSSTVEVDSGRVLFLRRPSLYARQEGASSHPPRYVVEDMTALPTARQLSSDRQFSVFEDKEASWTRASPQDRVERRASYAQSTVSSQQHRHTQARTPSSASFITRRGGAAAISRSRTEEPVWHTNLNTPTPLNKRGASPLAPLSDTATSSRSSVSPPQRQSAPRRVSVSVSRSPSSPGSLLERRTGTNASSKKTPTLSPHLLDTVQSAASAMLMRCAKLDTHRTGCIPTYVWPQVLRHCCPSLTNVERRMVEEWVAQVCRRHTSTRGDAYADVVEEILTHCSGAAMTPSLSSDGSPYYRKMKSTHSPVTPSSASSMPAVTATTSITRKPAGSPLQNLSPNTTPHAKEDNRAEADRLLRDELMAACGGDTEALRSYLDAFDEAHQGYLHAHVWRASLKELFRRTMSREAPHWVLERCFRLSRRPFERVAAQQKKGTGTMQPVSMAEKAACTRIRRIPPKWRDSLCDYRYVLQELGLDVLAQ